MKKFSHRILSLSLMLYITSLIVFKQNYFAVTHIFDFMLILSYVFISLLKKDIIIELNYLIVTYGLFVFFAFASSFWALNFDIAADKGMKLFLIIINLVIIYNVTTKYKLHNEFMIGILLGSFINFILLLNIVPAPFPIYDQGRAMGTLGNANTLALSMVTSILISIIYLNKEKEINKIFFYYQYINIFLSLYMIFLTVSKKGILFGSVLIITFLILSIKNPKSLLKIGIMSMIIIVVFSNVINMDDIQNNFTKIVNRFSALDTQLESTSNFGSTGRRRHFIELGWNYFMHRPVFGHGIDNFRVYQGTYSHNNYVELLFGLGFIGFLLYYSIYFFVLKKILNMKNKNLKIMLSMVIINMLLVDIAVVSYGSKLGMYVLLFILIVAETNNFHSSNKELVNAAKN